MNGKRFDWHFIAGLAMNSAVLLLKHTIGLHDFINGFGTGLGITMMIYGIIVMSGRNVSGVKRFKRRLTGGCGTSGQN